MRVRAKEMGFFAGSRRRPGAEFDLPEGFKLAKWMEVVDAKAPAPKNIEPKTPSTWAEANRKLAAGEAKVLKAKTKSPDAGGELA